MKFTAIHATAQLLLEARHPAIIVTSQRVWKQLSQLRGIERVDLRLISDNQDAAEATVDTLINSGCDLVLCWQTCLSLVHDSRPGALLLPTRIVDGDSQERYDTVLVRFGRRDRAALLSTATVADSSARRRLAMKFQCLAIDRICAPVARATNRHGVPLLVICTLVDTRALLWSTLRHHWVNHFGRYNPLRWLADGVYRLPEFWVAKVSRYRADMALIHAGDQLEEGFARILDGHASTLSAQTMADITD